MEAGLMTGRTVLVLQTFTLGKAFRGSVKLVLILYPILHLFSLCSGPPKMLNIMCCLSKCICVAGLHKGRLVANLCYCNKGHLSSTLAFNACPFLTPGVIPQ